MQAGVLLTMVVVLTGGWQNLDSSQTNSSFITPSNQPQLSMQKKRRPPVNFIPAVKIQPSNLLLDWLNTTKNNDLSSDVSRKLLRLPVVIQFKDKYRFGISQAVIGKSDADINKDSIFLKLNDHQMGASLLMQLIRICPKTGNSCVVWLDGYWGESRLLSLDSESQEDIKKWPFTVRVVHELVKQDHQSQEVMVFIESP